VSELSTKERCNVLTIREGKIAKCKIIAFFPKIIAKLSAIYFRNAKFLWKSTKFVFAILDLQIVILESHFPHSIPNKCH